jgi:protease I
MAKRVLIPIPCQDFDPTESAIPWTILKAAGVEIFFATPDGQTGECDMRMLHGFGLGPLSRLLAADSNGRAAYEAMSNSREFKTPIKWSDIDVSNFDGLILPGGHAKGMREYLESRALQTLVGKFFETKKPIGAICHGVVLAARSKTTENKSILYGLKTTALLASQEISAWLLTVLWLGNYYRTYPQTVESEVKLSLASNADFLTGPVPLLRDNPQNLSRGFVVQDRNYLSARWPGDAHLFAHKFLEMLA